MTVAGCRRNDCRAKPRLRGGFPGLLPWPAERLLLWGEFGDTHRAMDPLAFYQWLYEKTDGRLTWLAGLPVLLLRTVGAKTGVERTAALVYLKDGDNLVVVASSGGSDTHPGWYFNIKKHPDVGVQIGREHRRLRARRATREEETRLWPVILARAPQYGRYRAKTSREIPLVLLEAQPTGASS